MVWCCRAMADRLKVWGFDITGDWGIQAIHSQLGDGVLTNEKLALERPEWDMERLSLERA